MNDVYVVLENIDKKINESNLEKNKLFDERLILVNDRNKLINELNNLKCNLSYCEKYKDFVIKLGLFISTLIVCLSLPLTFNHAVSTSLPFYIKLAEMYGITIVFGVTSMSLFIKGSNSKYKELGESNSSLNDKIDEVESSLDVVKNNIDYLDRDIEIVDKKIDDLYVFKDTVIKEFDIYSDDELVKDDSYKLVLVNKEN